MSQRLARKFHPHTGQPIVPLGYRKNGKAIWPILGGSEDDKGDGTGDAGDGTGDGTGSTGTDSTDEGDKGDEGKDPRIKELSDEAARRRVEAKNLKTQLDEALGRLKTIDDKDKSEVERLTTRVTELEQATAEKDEALKQARIQNAFLASNKYEWHNPDRALSLADLSEVAIDDDGKVSGLDKALDALAKSDAYLLKPKDDGTGKPPAGPTGTPAGSGKDKDKGALDREKLAAKYPVLRR